MSTCASQSQSRVALTYLFTCYFNLFKVYSDLNQRHVLTIEIDYHMKYTTKFFFFRARKKINDTMENIHRIKRLLNQDA